MYQANNQEAYDTSSDEVTVKYTTKSYGDFICRRTCTTEIGCTCGRK